MKTYRLKCTNGTFKLPKRIFDNKDHFAIFNHPHSNDLIVFYEEDVDDTEVVNEQKRLLNQSRHAVKTVRLLKNNLLDTVDDIMLNDDLDVNKSSGIYDAENIEDKVVQIPRKLIK